LLRTRSTNLYWTGTVDYKRLTDDAAGVQIDDRNSESVSGGVRGDHLRADEKSSLVYLLTLTAGKLNDLRKEFSLTTDMPVLR
jgi:hypothetical protein